jgi:NitT/TauT family transport system permease protein
MTTITSGLDRAAVTVVQGEVDAYSVAMVDPQKKRDRKLGWWIFAGRVGILVVLLAAWQIAGIFVDPLVISSPVAVFQAFIAYAQTSLGPDLLSTMEEVVIGYVIGAVGGILLGVLLASNRWIAGVLDPFIVGIYGVPKIAFGPLLVVWLGINLAPKVALAALMVFFLVFFSSYEGIRNVDKDKINAVRLMGASPFQLRRYVIFPGARGSIFLGLKLGVPEALVGAIVGEFISSSQGVGFHILSATAQLDTAGVFSGLIILTVLSLVLNALVKIGSRNKA